MASSKYEHPHDEFNYKDSSIVVNNKIQNDGPILFQPIIGTKGKDSTIMTFYNVDDYVTEFGEPNLTVTGQGSYQAKAWLEGGGILKTIRLSAKDAKRANSILILKLKLLTQQETNADGDPLYIDSVTGGETIISTGNKPLMKDVAKVKLFTKSVTDISINPEDARMALCNLYARNEETREYEIPLLGVVCKGKGKYGNTYRYRFTINNARDRQTNFRNYHLQIFENQEGGMEEIANSPLQISLYPDSSYNKKTQYIQDVVNGLSDVPVYLYTVPEYFNEVTELLLPVFQQDDPNFESQNIDLLLFSNEELEPYKHIIVDENSINVSAIEGYGLKNGSDGNFVLTNEARQKEINERFLDLFEGKVDSTILDPKQQEIHLVLDANYPLEVKKSLRLWSIKRKDVPVVFDAGITSTYAEVMEFLKEDTAFDDKDFMIETQNFDTKDPITGKLIRVTSTYLFAIFLVKHIIDPLNGNNIPFAGENIILDDYIEEGSLKPVYSTEEQKSAIYKARGNYIEKENGHYIFNSNVTTQIDDSEMSYFNNTLVYHEIVRDLKKLGATFRFKNISTLNDVSKLNKLGNSKLEKYIGTKILAGEFEVTKDTTDPRQKTTRSKIKLGFNSYVLDNIFDIEIERA